MSWQFNPFTGTFDIVGTGGGGGGSPGGASLTVQYNNGGSFAGMSGTSWDDANRSLTLTGATVTTDKPVLDLSQTWNASGVTFTGLRFNATDTASAAGSLLLDLQLGGTTQLRVTKAGILERTGSIVLRPIGSGGYAFDANGFSLGSDARVLTFGASADTRLSRGGVATLQLGNADAAAPVAQTLQAQSVVAGTTNTAGANFTINGSRGTGNAAGGSIIFQVAPAGASGTAQNAYATALTIDSASKLTVGGNGVIAPASFANVNTQFGNGTFTVLRTDTGATQFSVSATGRNAQVSANGTFGWSNTNDAASSQADVILARDAANTLALRNGANAQTFNIYNTYTDAANYERAALYWSSNSAWLTTETAGSGSLRSLNVNGLGLNLRTSGTLRWQIDTSGHFIAGTDNQYDIGASGANRPRSAYIGTSVVSGSLVVTSRGQLTSGGTSDGQLRLTNAANNGFDRLQFGGGTTSFPALKRSAATLQVRLADDSGFATIDGQIQMEGTAPASATATGTAGDLRYDSGYIYVCTATDTWKRVAIATWP